MSVKTLVLTILVLFSIAAIPVSAGPIHQAALMGDVAKIKALAEKDPEIVDKRDENGLTPLFWCVYADQPDAAAMLISLKADIDATDDCKDTPLHIATSLGTCEMVRMLVSKGANAEIKDQNGCTPLMIAKRLDKPEVVEALLCTTEPKASDTKLASSSLETSKVTLPAPARKSGAPGTKAVNYTKRTVRGVPLNVITVNLNDARVSVSAAVAQNGIGTDEAFSSFIKRCAPTAAINGTFFSKTSLRPIGDIVIKGNLVHWGGMGTALCLTEDCKPIITTVERHKHIDWSDYKTVVASGPRLLTQGQITVDPASEGFRDPHVLGRSNRTGAGITKSNTLILANTTKSVSLTEWANIMKTLGCTDAVNFDGGASMAMYYRGKTISPAGRKLTNVLLIYER